MPKKKYFITIEMLSQCCKTVFFIPDEKAKYVRPFVPGKHFQLGGNDMKQLLSVTYEFSQ